MPYLNYSSKTLRQSLVAAGIADNLVLQCVMKTSSARMVHQKFIHTCTELWSCQVNNLVITANQRLTLIKNPYCILIEFFRLNMSCYLVFLLSFSTTKSQRHIKTIEDNVLKPHASCFLSQLIKLFSFFFQKEIIACRTIASVVKTTIPMFHLLAA